MTLVRSRELLDRVGTKHLASKLIDSKPVNGRQARSSIFRSTCPKQRPPNQVESSPSAYRIEQLCEVASMPKCHRIAEDQHKITPRASQIIVRNGAKPLLKQRDGKAPFVCPNDDRHICMKEINVLWGELATDGRLLL